MGVLCDPNFWIGVVSILLAVALPLYIERIRRPILEVSLGEPVANDTFRIVHVQARNLPMAERRSDARFFGKWLTAHAADGCGLKIEIFSRATGETRTFPGKWSSRIEPTTDGTFDVQKLAGIHELTLQPGADPEQVAVAIRRRSGAYAYAYDAAKIYDVRPGTFPLNSQAELAPGKYEVRVEAKAGEVHTYALNLVLDVEAPPSDDLTLDPRVPDVVLQTSS